MKRPFILNPILNDMFKREQNQYMMRRIGNAKSSIKTDCPESFSFYKKNFRKNHPKRNIRKYFKYI